jgi:hypothetical protein
VQLGARHGRPNELGLAGLVDAMHGENILGEIDADEYDSHGLPLLDGELMRELHFPSWHSLPYRATPRAPRVGEVPFIR